jgi:hypothetical protein
MLMAKLAAFVMAGRWQATSTVIGFALLGLLLPPLTLLSGAALALVGLRLGAGQALSVLAPALVAVTVVSAFTTGHAWIGAIYGLAQWGPVLALALALRHSFSLAFALLTATAVGLLAVAGIEILAPGIEPLWTNLLDQTVRPALMQAQLPTETVDALLAQTARVMTGAVVAATLLSLALTLLLARWWQALLYNPGGFRNEFVGLALGRPAAGITLGLAVGAMLTKASLLIELALVGSAVFFLQGMAVTHAMLAKSAYPGLWLAGVYGLLLLALPQTMAGLATLGAVDAFADFRARLARSGE